MLKRFIMFFESLLFCLSLISCFSNSPEETKDYAYGCDFTFEINNESSSDLQVEVYAVFSVNLKNWYQSQVGAISPGCEKKNIAKSEKVVLKAGYTRDGISNGEYVSFVIKLKGKFYIGFDKTGSFFPDESENALFESKDVEKDNIFIVYTKADTKNDGTLYSSKMGKEMEFASCSYEDASRTFLIQVTEDSINVK